MDDYPVKSLPRLTPINNIEIWQPRFKDKVVLIAKYKVGTHNRITFTRAKHLDGMQFYIAGPDVAQYPLDTNGKIPCYAVPMDKLMRLEEE